MPEYVISKVADALNEEGKPINGASLILGLAYKANVDDCRESPSFVLMEKLEAKGAELIITIHLYPSFRQPESMLILLVKNQWKLKTGTISFWCLPCGVQNLRFSVLLPTCRFSKLYQ